MTGTLDGKRLDKGICAWVETAQGPVEVWVDEKYGQVFVFKNDQTLGGIYTLDPSTRAPDKMLAPRGARVTVTGTTYESTPECGAYGVRVTQPIVLA